MPQLEIPRSIQQQIAVATVQRASARQAILEAQEDLGARLDENGIAGPLNTVAQNHADAINEVLAIAQAGGGSTGNIDGGSPASIYGGTTAIDGGTP